ncbi:MAG: hypothetical protein F2840_09550 [Actinobacteria bacterium]|jgi:hypothetical protein|uniref:Unannotated protein n=1 Tax=freshwater metagenome TaxID=449393 RepID=A0A6J7KQR5_9ZZZZ|nr:hypothetical protein [Actinomycetota bacterium]
MSFMVGARSVLSAAIAYYTDYPDEIDGLLAEADRAEVSTAASLERRLALLG